MPYHCAIAIPAFLLNSLVFLHHTTAYKKLVPSIYLLNTSCDCLMILSLLCQHMLLELYHKAPTEATSVFIILFTALMATSYRCSVFSNVLLAVSRTIQVSNPFYQIRKKYVHRAFAIYLGIWLSLAVYDVIYIVVIDNYQYGVIFWADLYSNTPTTGYGVRATLFHWLGQSSLQVFLINVVLYSVPRAHSTSNNRIGLHGNPDSCSEQTTTSWCS